MLCYAVNYTFRDSLNFFPCYCPNRALVALTLCVTHNDTCSVIAKQYGASNCWKNTFMVNEITISDNVITEILK